jgi:membrane-associated phospholipid phosphatase
MRQRALVIWLVIGLLAVSDLLLCRHLHMRFYHWAPLALACAVTGGISVFYRVSGRSAGLACATHWTLAWLVFVNAGTVLTYIAATCGGLVHDATLTAIDAALGFDWRGWAAFLAPHPALRFVLWLAYMSLFPQILISIFWFSRTDADSNNYELLLNNIISLLVTTAIFSIFPALGVQTPGREVELHTLIMLRDGNPSAFDLSRLQGLISFPSYHTVLAVLLTYAHRRSKLLIPIAAINGVMLFSIPPFGGHYLIDMIGGAVIALLAIAATSAVPRPRRIAPATIA